MPFYRLPALQRELVPFYERKGTRWQTYGGLLYGWFIENRAPHTDWSVDLARSAIRQRSGSCRPAKGRASEITLAIARVSLFWQAHRSSAVSAPRA